MTIIELVCFPIYKFASVVGLRNKKTQILTLDLGLEFNDYSNRIFDFTQLDFMPHSSFNIKGQELDNHIVLIEIMRLTGFHRQRLNLKGPEVYFEVNDKQLANLNVQEQEYIFRFEVFNSKQNVQMELVTQVKKKLD